jgi:hypothetical protein
LASTSKARRVRAPASAAASSAKPDAGVDHRAADRKAEPPAPERNASALAGYRLPGQCFRGFSQGIVKAGWAPTGMSLWRAVARDGRAA